MPLDAEGEHEDERQRRQHHDPLQRADEQRLAERRQEHAAADLRRYCAPARATLAASEASPVTASM